MARDGTNWMDRGRQDLERELFWKVPVSPECIFLVDSPDSEDFSRLLLALEQATIIAVDAEWKPIFDKNAGAAHPRVSILQIACRLQGNPRLRENHRENGHSKEVPYRAEDKNAGLMSSQMTVESTSRSKRKDQSCGEGECRGDVIVQGSGSESASDTGGLQMENSPEIEENVMNNISKEMKERNKHDRALDISQLRERSNWDEEDVKAAESVSPNLARFLANLQKSTVQTFKSTEHERERQCLGSSQHGANDGSQVRGVSVRERIDEEETLINEQMNTGQETKDRYEIIFLLDLLTLPASAFSGVLKGVFADPRVLKLGFGFKQDLMHLRGTFPGPDSHGCFDKVEPYLDIGKLYLHIHENRTSFTHRGKRMATGGHGLATVCEMVLGLPLRKDMQCSNWEQRPLTAEQFDYAAADAYCLLAVFDALQVKVSESWFLPNVAGDNESVFRTESNIGAGLLSLANGDFEGNGHKYAFSSICQPKRGNAPIMVEAALREAGLSGQRRVSIANDLHPKTHLTLSKTVDIEVLIRRFGEKLLISGGQTITNKRVRRKTRNRRAREAGRSGELKEEEDLQYQGPPPWDNALGGDGIPKFLCDAMVEGLARQLRCVGIDAASLNSKKCEPRELVHLAEKEGRVLLTRDVKLLRRRLVPTDLAYRVKRQGKWDQLAEIIETFKLLISEDQLLTRCTKCNGHFIQKPLSAKEAAAQGPWSQVIPDCALKNVDEFWQCSNCKHLYWQGTQFTRAYEQFVAVCHSKKNA